MAYSLLILKLTLAGKGVLASTVPQSLFPIRGPPLLARSFVRYFEGLDIGLEAYILHQVCTVLGRHIFPYIDLDFHILPLKF